MLYFLASIIEFGEDELEIDNWLLDKILKCFNYDFSLKKFVSNDGNMHEFYEKINF